MLQVIALTIFYNHVPVMCLLFPSSPFVGGDVSEM